MAKEVVKEGGPSLAAKADGLGPSTGGAEISDMVGNILEGAEVKSPEPVEKKEADPAAEHNPVIEPEVEEPAAEPEKEPAEEAEAPFVPPQALGKEEPKPEEDDDDYTPPEAQGDTKAAHAWKSVKQERKQLKAENAELAEKISALEAKLSEAPPQEDTSKSTEELVALREQVATLEGKLGEYDLSSTSSFKQKFDQPIMQVVKRGASILTRTGVEAADAQKLMAQITDPSKTMDDIQDVIADYPMAVQGALMNVVGEFGELAERRSEALAHWKETKAAMKDHESRETEVKIFQDVEKNTQAALDSLLKEGNWMYAPGDNEDWNKQVNERVQTAKGVLRSASREDLVKYVLEGVAARPLRQMFESTYKLAEERKAELDKLVGAQPGFRGSPDAGKPKDPASAKKGTPQQPGDVINSLFSDERSMQL